MMRQALAFALALLVACGAQAQAPAAPPAGTASAAPAGTACPQAQDVEPRQLLGLWRAQFDGLARGATLLLEPHRVYAGSLAGEIDRNGERSKVAADLDDDGFTLEESSDGQHIAATWLGDVVEGSCGKEIRGSWEPAHGDRRGFVLRKLDH